MPELNFLNFLVQAFSIKLSISIAPRMPFSSNLGSHNSNLISFRVGVNCKQPPPTIRNIFHEKEEEEKFSPIETESNEKSL